MHILMEESRNNNNKGSVKNTLAGAWLSENNLTVKSHMKVPHLVSERF